MEEGAAPNRMNQSAQSRAATRCQQTAATGCEVREGQVAESGGLVEIQRTLAITHNEESQIPCVPNLLTFQRRQLRPEVDGGGGIPPTFLSGTNEVQH